MDPEQTRSARPLDASTRQQLAAWVDAHWSSVFALLYRLCGGDRHQAEDLTQETFLKAAERRESFTEGTNLRAWLMRIGTNSFLDAKRRATVAKAVPMPEEAEYAAADDRGTQRLEVAELSAKVATAIDGLPDTARTVFLLRTQQELSFRDIAGIIGATEETARWHMMQARRHLIAKLGELD